MSDPFHLEGPAVIAFSGGRTSGYMLHRIVQAHGGALPADVVPVFCNTGKEHERTLDFVRDCGERWGVRIRWVEYTPHPEPDRRWREVDYASASRAGEPFEAVIRSKNFLPNPVTRFCTSEMKIKASMNFAHYELGFQEEHWRAIGLRADEPGRVSKGRDRYATGKDGWGPQPCYPLYDGGVTIAEVVAFWKAQPFDLMLPLAPDGTTPLGNCDLCFLKGGGKISSIIAMEPARADWWVRMEALIAPVAGRDNGLFRHDRPRYSMLRDQGTLIFDDSPDTIDCACTD